MKKADIAANELFAVQHQLITREQFLDQGTRHQLAGRVANGSFERVYEAVFRRAGVAPYWRQDVLAACFGGGRYSVGGFRTAAAIDGLPGGEEVVEITSRRHNRLNYAGVISHETVYLEDRDIKIVDAIPITRTARTLCDLAGLVEMGEFEKTTVELAFLEALRRNIVSIESVWREHERLAGTYRLGGRVMLDILKNLVPPLRTNDTTTEDRVLLMLREAGFPEPTPQFWMTLPDGERIRLDFAWPEWRAGLEWDPYKFHGARDRYEAMASRTRRLGAIKWRRVCVTDADFDNGMPESIAELRTIFEEKGVLISRRL